MESQTVSVAESVQIDIISKILNVREGNQQSEFGMRPYSRLNTKYFAGDWIHYRNSNIPLTIPQMTLLQLAFILGTLGVLVVYWKNGQRQRQHLPPGPKKLPFIGNLLSMPRAVEWETFTKWGQEYSLCLISCTTLFISCFAQTPTLFTSTL